MSALELITLEDELTANLVTYLVSAGKDGLIKVWDLAIEDSLHTISGQASEVLCLHYVESEGILIVGTNAENLLFHRIGSGCSVTSEGVFKRASFARPLQIQYVRSILFVLSTCVLRA